MKLKGTGSVFGEDLLEKLPVNYRYMARIETRTFREHRLDARFSASHPHQSKQLLMTGSYKPLSNIIYQDFFEADGNV